MTRGRGVDFALDGVGAATFTSTINALPPPGMAVSFGRASGPPPPVDVWALSPRGARVASATLFQYITDPEEMQWRATEVIQGLKAGWLRPTASTSFKLADVTEAHRALESRQSYGKLILRPER